MQRILCLLAFICVTTQSIAQHLFELKKGVVEFVSDAPLEVITARSKKLSGILDISKKQFAFKVEMRSFDGFNNAMQKGHFNENYMESNTFPLAVFKGKIIEDIDLDKKGTITVRAKGKFTVHGVEQERIIPVTLKIGAQRTISVSSKFNVMLADHNIKVPKVVIEKLSPEIWVTVNGVMTEKP